MFLIEKNNGNLGRSSSDLSSEIQSATECTHCGLPVPEGLVQHDRAAQFCCQGCQAAYHLIHECGLESYYEMLENYRSTSPAEKNSKVKFDAQFDEFDTDQFLKTYSKNLNSELYRIELFLEGIHCAACVWLLEKLPSLLAGVQLVRVNWSRSSVEITWNSNSVSLGRIAKTLNQLGYTPHPVRNNEKDAIRISQNRRHLTRIGFAAAAAGNNMLIAAALYLGMFSYMSGSIETMLRVASCIVGVVALAFPGRVFLQGAIAAIRTRTPHMDLPVGLGLLIGTLAGLMNTIRGSGEIYFDSLTLLIFLLLVGRWIQFRQQNRAADAIELLFRMTPKFARKITAGNVVKTPIEQIVVGDHLELLAGDLVPVDGIVTCGAAHFDESLLTGESNPHRKQVGEIVSAGTQNLDEVVQIRTLAVGSETRLSSILQMVENATLQKPGIVQWANRVGGYFVVAIIVAAACTFLFWLSVDWSTAVDHSVALLIVACPCALALATPLAVSIALGRAAKQKIMIKSGDVFERLNSPGMIWLDKTGTLTEGQLTVTKWYGDESVIPYVVSIEKRSSHPVAAALVRGLQSESNSSLESISISESTTGGIQGSVEGHQVAIGNRNFVEAFAEFRLEWDQIEREILDSFCSPCWISLAGELVAVAAIGDRIRSDTANCLDSLRNNGWRVGILSGDHQEIVNRVANELAVDPNDARGRVTPEQKVAVINQSLKQFKTVVMVGDGVNDCAALAASSVGIAVKHGAEASLAAAPVYFAENGLRPILNLMRLSKSTNHTIRKSLGVSLFYNLVTATLAAFGFINPLVAAILMPVSSLTVVGLSIAPVGTQPSNNNDEVIQ